MLKNIIPRLYQETILSTASQKNTLVVLPTGMGKTAIAILLAAHRFKNFPNSKVIILAPTKPLAQQHLQTFKENLEFTEEQLVIYTGEVAPEKRKQQWENAKIIFATPQGLQNDVINNSINLENVSLIVFDEAHRATGDYTYNFISEQYNKKARFPRILALTASPGTDEEKITEVCNNLSIEAVEVRTEESPDVKQYIQEIDIKWIEVLMPEEFKKIRKHLVECFNSKIKAVKELGLIDKNTSISTISKKELLGLQASIHAQISQGEKSFETLKAISLLAEGMKAQHAIELVETQGISSLHIYMHNLVDESATTKVKAVKNLVIDENFKSALYLCDKLAEIKVEHPKLEALKDLVKKEIKNNKEIKIILFNQYRDTATKLNEELNKIEGVKSKIFVGQLKKNDTGMSQKNQK
ncbi:MAG: DEAD/DEAH box helicase, partial [Nanoarchaeota archaeon]|nr:DEAD/DEAH box helicase [Nanoarchaeota archaeon]